MGQWAKARIQLCGRYVADIDGSRIEHTLPGRLGRVLFAYLVLNRGRAVPRDKLLMAGWGQDAPAEAGNALSVQLSKLRRGLGAARYPLTRWWEYCLAQGWAGPVEYFAPPFGRGSLLQGWSSMPAVVALKYGLEAINQQSAQREVA